MPGFPEAIGFGSGHHRQLAQLFIVSRFGFGQWDVADGFEQPPVVEPFDPFQCVNCLRFLWTLPGAILPLGLTYAGLRSVLSGKEG